MADAQIRAVITAKDDASSTLKQVGRDIENFGNGARKFLGDAVSQATLVGAAGLAALTAAAVTSVKAFEESQNLIAQTNAVLASTKGIAGVSAQAVEELSKALERVTKFSDEDVRSVENLLLTFTAIGKNIFPESTKAVLNMATALGEDTKSAAIQLGKALQDPILGITALRRVGVSFSEEQKKVIKDLVETGQSAKAQQLILAELNREFGGSAEAAGKTFAGSLAILKNQVHDVEEAIGQFIVNAIIPLVTWAARVVAAINWDKLLENIKEELQKAADKIAIFIAPIKEFLVKHKDPLLMFMKDFAVSAAIVIPLLITLGAAVAVATSPLFLITLAVAAIIFIWDKWHVQIIATWDTVKKFAIGIWQAIDGAFHAIVISLEWLKNNWQEALGFMIGFFISLPFKLEALVNEAVHRIIEAIIHVKWSDVFEGMWRAGVSAWDAIGRAALSTLNTIKSIDWGGVFLGIEKSIANSIIGIIEGAIHGAVKGIPGMGSLEHIKLPRLDSGVENFEGGLAYVHKGEMLVNMPKGTNVIPAAKVAATSAPTINITIQAGAYMGNPSDARKYAQMIAQSLKDVAGMKNMTAAEMLS